MASRYLIFRCADGQMLLDATEDVPFLYDKPEDIRLDGEFVPVCLVPAEEYEAMRAIIEDALGQDIDESLSRRIAAFLEGAHDEP